MFKAERRAQTVAALAVPCGAARTGFGLLVCASAVKSGPAVSSRDNGVGRSYPGRTIREQIDIVVCRLPLCGKLVVMSFLSRLKSRHNKRIEQRRSEAFLKATAGGASPEQARKAADQAARRGNTNAAITSAINS
jgi:hypothetical protein